MCEHPVSIRFGPAEWHSRNVEFHLGRVIDHVHLRVRDLDASRRFYEAALGVLGLEVHAGGDYFSADEIWVTADGPPTTGLHLAFQAADEDAVRRFHQAAIAAGGTDNGQPGERMYHPGYFAAYALDPDGNNVEAVFHGPARRSADSVIVTPAD
jgi:catechol 2,3-dioxygenase-like lactoylglutathione lyase family enzyme